MKTENTIENKQIFFSLYFKQKVRKMMCLNGDFTDEVYHNYELSNVDEDYLELTSVSKITDEDAIEVAKIRGGQFDGWNIEDLKKEETKKFYKENMIAYGKETIYFLNNNSHAIGNVSYIVDFIRSKGYALPYLRLSVNSQIEYGWVKLKE